MRITAVHLQPYRLRFARPIRTSAGLFVQRTGTLVHVQTDRGLAGCGDAAAWPGFGSGESAVQSGMAKLPARLLGASLKGLPDIDALTEGCAPEVAHAVELACLDLFAQQQGNPVAALLTDAPFEQVPVHALITDAVQAVDAVRAGARAVKLKIGVQSLGDEGVRLGALRAAIGPEVGLRLDVNGAWSVEQAQRAMRILMSYTPEWLEQPVAGDDIAGLAEVKAVGTLAVAADEAVQTAEHLEAVIAAKAADIIVIKPMFAGGLRKAYALHQRAVAAGLRTLVTHTLESAVGRMGAVHLAAACGPGVAHGLGNPMATDVCQSPTINNYMAELPRAAGLGVRLPMPQAQEAAAC